MKTNHLLFKAFVSSFFTASILLSSSSTFAQVKIGANPTTIGTNSNLEVESSDGTKVMVNKSNGFVGVNTTSPVDRLTINGNVNAIGYTTRAGISPGLVASNVFNLSWDGTNAVANLWIDNFDRGSILTTLNSGGRPSGFATRTGTGGSYTSNVFNISWDGATAYPNLWIDNLDRGTIMTSLNSGARTNGFATRGGTTGVYNSSHLFNIDWDGTYPNFYMDNSNQGALVTTQNVGVRKEGFATRGGTGGAFGLNLFNIDWDGTYPNFYMDNSNQGALVTTQNVGVRKEGFATRGGIGGTFGLNLFNIYWNGTTPYLYIDGANIGAISTTSDYRLKKNVLVMDNNALARISKLRPVSFEYKDVEGNIFKADGKVNEGFIAHELQAVIPSAVNGEKDGLTKDGKIQPQTLNPFPVISVLTKAIQEQQLEIEQLKAENKKLKGDVASLNTLQSEVASIKSMLNIADKKLVQK